MTYYGGKNHIFRRIVNLIPEHERFVELFAGSAAVSRNLERRHAEAFMFELDPDQAKKLRLELPGHRVHNADALEWLYENRLKIGPETVLFCDPPYPIADRRDPTHRYKCELTGEQHKTLILRLMETKAKVLVCGQPWGLYARAFQNWKRHEFRVTLRSGEPGIECVWTNFQDPYPLHDYSFWGENKRVRQDLHRQTARALAKFEKMEKNVRLAVLRQLVERFGPGRSSSAEAPSPTAESAGLPARTSEARTPTRAARRGRKANPASLERGRERLRPRR